uniref:Uncharacterized protein n=1 Tax=Ascaris lumbricoides TaxID=6252 RepID=A0A0M3IAT6_ASCLU
MSEKRRSYIEDLTTDVVIYKRKKMPAYMCFRGIERRCNIGLSQSRVCLLPVVGIEKGEIPSFKNIASPRCPKDLWSERVASRLDVTSSGKCRIFPLVKRNHSKVVLSGIPSPTFVPVPFFTATLRIISCISEEFRSRVPKRHDGGTLQERVARAGAVASLANSLACNVQSLKSERMLKP